MNKRPTKGYPALVGVAAVSFGAIAGILTISDFRRIAGYGSFGGVVSK